MILLLILIMSECIFSAILCVIFAIRNHSVHLFRLMILDRVSAMYFEGNIDEAERLLSIYKDGPSYGEMLYNFWVPLEIENWYHDDSIKKLIS